MTAKKIFGTDRDLANIDPKFNLPIPKLSITKTVTVDTSMPKIYRNLKIKFSISKPP
jgi:hypothetical protein